METYQVTTRFLPCVWYWKQSALGFVESGLWDKVITHPAFIACSIANNESWDMRSWRAATYNKWELWWEKLEMWDSTRHPPVHVTACMGCQAFPSSRLTLRNRTITDKATHCSHEWNDYCTTMSRSLLPWFLSLYPPQNPNKSPKVRFAQAPFLFWCPPPLIPPLPTKNSNPKIPPLMSLILPPLPVQEPQTLPPNPIKPSNPTGLTQIKPSPIPALMSLRLPPLSILPVNEIG